MCCVAAAVGIENASYVVSLMLRALQHRGQQGAGISSRDSENTVHTHKGFGLVDEVFRNRNVRALLPGDTAIGHGRYPTTGGPNNDENNQPIVNDSRWGRFAVAHNGNLSNGAVLRHELEGRGATFRSTTDTELFAVLYARRNENEMKGRLLGVFPRVQGAYSLVGVCRDGFFAARDPWGFRPLVRANYQDGFLVASESRAFNLFRGISNMEEVPPGHLITAHQGGVALEPFARAQYLRACSFEDIYYSMPDSVAGGETISQKRERLGILLARRLREAGLGIDVVISVPDSSTVAAVHVAEAIGRPFRFGIVRNKYMGRTFITPDQEARERDVEMKLNVDVSVVRGMRVLVVDDSIVRSTTMKKIVRMLRDAGAAEVHVAITSPPVKWPCFWGIDTPERRQLIAAHHTVDEVRRILDADSLTYLTVEDLLQALRDPTQRRTCVSCFTGCKPVRGHKLDNGGYDQ